MKLTLNQLKIIVDAMDYYEESFKFKYPHNEEIESMHRILVQEFLTVKNMVNDEYDWYSLIKDRLKEDEAIEAADFVEWSFDEEEDD